GGGGGGGGGGRGLGLRTGGDLPASPEQVTGRLGAVNGRVTSRSEARSRGRGGERRARHQTALAAGRLAPPLPAPVGPGAPAIAETRATSWAHLSDLLYEGSWNPAIRRYRPDVAYRGLVRRGQTPRTSLMG